MRNVLLAPLMAALLACSSHDGDPLAAARNELAAQDLGTARQTLVAALKVEPANPALLDLLADVQLRMGDAVAARATIERLAKAGGRGLRFDQLLAEALLMSGKPAEALARLGTDTAPDSLRIRAAALLQEGDPAGAIALWQQGSMTSGPGALRLALDHGLYLAETGDIAGARGVLARMTAAGPDSFETALLTGRVALLGGDPESAQTAFAAAMRRFPRRIEPACGLAEALDAKGAVGPALAELERADAAMPGQPCVLDNRLSLLSQQGEWGKIRAMLQDREASLDPASAAGMTYAEALLRLGRPEQARALFAQALLVSPDNPYARLMLGEAALETGDAAAARDTLAPLARSILAGERELQLAARAAQALNDPAAAGFQARLNSGSWRQVQAINARGLAAVARQDWSTAIAAWQELLGQGFDPELQRRLAYALSRAGRHEEAIAAADALLGRAPDSADALYLAGLTRTDAGQDQARATALLEQAVSREPANWTYRQALAKAKAAAG